MEKKIYVAPCMMQVEWTLEALCIAASAAGGATVDSGINPEPWTEGNTNWW